MCGILGGIGVRPFDFLDDRDHVLRAIDALRHRGPDDSGLHVSPERRSFLGHRRLSIIDLAGGHQPIADETGRVHLCYNGEVYNFRDLRSRLTARGHVFRTQTDGETALHLYQDDPACFVTALHGMFGLAILDEPAGRLTLARDRLGIKPLYYWRGGNALLFASELKAILALLPRRPALSAAALQQYLRWKYIPAPRTVYEDIFELPPGHLLTATRPADAGADLQIEVRRYWDLDFGVPKLADEREAVEQLDARLRAAVLSHLEADVEVGALLSGGVDSSLVVALASQVGGRRIKTFSVGFREPGFDQLPFARRLAESCGTEHHEEYVDVDPLAALPKLVRHFDQPFGDSSALACYYVCEVAARHVKVALTGDGGDETFAGYRRYADLRDAAEHDSARGASALHARPVPGRSWRRRANAALHRAGALLLSPEARWLQHARAAALPPLEAYEEREIMCTLWLTQWLLGPAYRAPAAGPDPIVEQRLAAAARGWDAVDIAQYADLHTYLSGDILAKVDRTSMAWSLECRVPLLDHSITEFAAGLALDLRIHGAEGKYLLKRVAERYVPADLLYRKKRGFRVPIRRWFKRDLLDQSADLLGHGLLVERGVLDPAGVRWVLRAQRRPWMNLSSCLWSLLFMEYWARAYPDT
ncbi:MAG: asparagine synthase (glutamine-hydrolyzing) [Planctomycetota bacterium]